MLFACSQAFASNDIKQLFENYFKGTAVDSPLYNFSAIFSDVNKIRGRAALEKKIEEAVFVLIEQEQSLEIIYLAVPLSYEESNFSKTLNLTYKNKNEIITVRYELLKTYQLKGMFTAVFEIKRMSRMQMKTGGRQAAVRMSNRFSQIKLDKDVSIYRFYNIKAPFFLLGGNMSSAKSTQRAQGKVLKAGEALNVVVGGEKIAVQQGEIEFDLNALAKLPPSPDTKIVAERPRVVAAAVLTKEPEKVEAVVKTEIVEPKKEEPKKEESAVVEPVIAEPQKEPVKEEPETAVTEIVEEPKKEQEPATIPEPEKKIEIVTKQYVQITEKKPDEYKGEGAVIKEFRPGEYIFPAMSAQAFEGPDLIILKDNVEMIAPADNSIVTFAQLIFKWRKFDKAVKYKLQISAGSFAAPLYERELNDIEYSLTATEIAGKFADSKKYSWRVIAYNINGREISKKETSYSFVYTEPEIFTAPVIANFTVLNKNIDDYENNRTLTKDDLENNLFIFNIKIEQPLNTTTKLKISYDGGAFYDMKAGQSEIDYIFEFKPNEDKLLKFAFAYEKNNETAELKNTPGSRKELIYIHKTNADLIKIMLDKYFQSVQSKDRDMYLECISRDFSGNNEGFTSFSDIRSTIRRVFDKQTFLSASYNNLNVDFRNSDRATVTFNFYFKILFENVGLEREIKSHAKLQLKKENGLWQILNDDRKLFVMEIFAPAPHPPAN